jgi:hypothetical protein
VLLGGVGTAPPTVALIDGRSAPVAIDGTPVVVVFLRIPVAKPERVVPLILVTVADNAPVPPDAVTSPVIEIV